MIVLLLNKVEAQKSSRPISIGTTDTTWLKKKLFDHEASLSAIILFDYGKCISEPYRGTTLTIQRRIKIFKKDAFEEWGNLVILENADKLTEFEGTVYNLDEKNVVIKNHINLKNVLLKKEKGQINGKVFFPNINEGSVIEYTYTIKTNTYTIFDWNFQHSIPVEWSEYELFFPGSMFGVSSIINGLFNLDQISAKQKGRLRKYILTNIPAFKEEPYMPNPKFYRSSIVFFPASIKRDFTVEYTKDRLSTEGITRDSSRMDTKAIVRSNFKIQLNGSLDGTMIIDRSGYGAKLNRELIKNIGEVDFIKTECGNNLWIVTNSSLENVKDINQPLITKMTLSIPNINTMTDSLLFIDPFVTSLNRTNPFKQKERLYPVDLGARIEHIIITELSYPEGFKVDALPSSNILTLPDKTASYITSITHTHNKIFITSKLKITKIVYNVPDYPALRDFFSAMVSKQSEQIVLKRVNTNK